MGCVGEREENITCIPSYSHALAIARMACKQLSVVGLQTCAAEVCTHTCSTHAILLTDSPLAGVCRGGPGNAGPAGRATGGRERGTKTLS